MAFYMDLSHHLSQLAKHPLPQGPRRAHRHFSEHTPPYDSYDILRSAKQNLYGAYKDLYDTRVPPSFIILLAVSADTHPSATRSTPRGCCARRRGRLKRRTAPMHHRPSTPKVPHDSPSGKPRGTRDAEGKAMHGSVFTNNGYVMFYVVKFW